MALLVGLFAALALPSALALKLSDANFEDLGGKSPVFKAIDLVARLEANVIADGKIEQQSYDKYMCWCEDSLNRKGKDIDSAKETIAKLGKSIPKLMAQISSHASTVKYLKRSIKSNQEEQEEAVEIRTKENTAYEAGKAESENSIGALEAAVFALTGAGEKKNFLETSKQAQLITVAADMKSVVDSPVASRSVSMEDMDTLRRFVDQPTAFLSVGVSALQTGAGNNPFGDYAPQSTQIQGILKGLYDGFIADMEKDHGEEADKQKAFEELMATKKKELADLQDTFEKHGEDSAEKVQKLADQKMERDDAKQQLEADTVFVAETTEGCQRKAKDWAVRSRLRTEELLGLGEGLKILRDPENQAIFTKSASTFVQLSSSSTNRATAAVQLQRQAMVKKAYQKLSSMAQNLNSLSLARIAVQAKLGGHFDQIMATMDERVTDLRKEEKEDIEHRDRCEAMQGKNKNDLEDLNHASTKTSAKIGTMESQIVDFKQKATDASGAIKATNRELAEVLRLRNEAHKAFKQGVKDDTMAAAIIRKAIAAMAKFYKKNQDAMLLLQGHATPEYTTDKDKAPETSWGSDSYGGRQSESTGALGALEAAVAKIEAEIDVARKDDAEAQVQYAKDKKALIQVRDANAKAKIEYDKSAASLKEDLSSSKIDLTEIVQELDGQKKLKASITDDCAWVATSFDSRVKARKAEIDGLLDAKALLSGAAKGDYDQLSLSVA